LAAPSAVPITVSYTTANGTALAGTNYIATSGTLTFAPGETTKGILVPTIDDGAADPTKGFTVNLSNPTGANITNNLGIATILDDTKFYVVDGGSSDSTYQYASAGSALGSNALGSGDTAPRGVADTAAGTTTWVVDANKNVYVYSTGGALLGSWSAGGLSSSVQLTGIATNGTDIWLLDGYNSKIYKYTGAAGLLSGSQSAASSFSLAGGNNSATDMVTDGTYLWVVNSNGKKSKIFKYTVSGSSQGNWTIDPANTSPTGITINPNNVSDIWIVDSGTKKVYQYIGAASRTSGSQSAGATFALAAGDANPQGIADPPSAEMLLAPAASPLSASASLNAATPNKGQPAAALSPLSARDVVFAMLGGDIAKGISQPFAGFATNAPLSDHQVTPLNSSIDWSPSDRHASLALTGIDSAAFDSIRGSRVNAESQLYAATDRFFVSLVDELLSGE
jgi:hypothetical protein